GHDLGSPWHRAAPVDTLVRRPGESRRGWEWFMASSRAVQSYVFWAGFTITVWVIFVGGALAFAVLDPAQDLNHVAITITAVYFVGAWVGASAVMLIARPDEWRRVSLRVRYARLMWTLALTAHLAHVLFAFWLAHGWSHDEAVRHVEEVCGFAE